MAKFNYRGWMGLYREGDVPGIEVVRQNRDRRTLGRASSALRGVAVLNYRRGGTLSNEGNFVHALRDSELLPAKQQPHSHNSGEFVSLFISLL